MSKACRQSLAKRTNALSASPTSRPASLPRSRPRTTMRSAMLRSSKAMVLTTTRGSDAVQPQELQHACRPPRRTADQLEEAPEAERNGHVDQAHERRQAD